MGGTLTKNDIVRTLAEKYELEIASTRRVVQGTLDMVLDALLKGDKVELRNFGVFEVKRRKARKARNPRTGDRVDVEPKNVVTFKPGKEMEERVRQLKLGDETVRQPQLTTVPPDDEESDKIG